MRKSLKTLPATNQLSECESKSEYKYQHLNIRRVKMNLIDMTRKAGQEANRLVPEFKKIGDEHHERWLKAYDAAFCRMLKEEE